MIIMFYYHYVCDHFLHIETNGWIFVILLVTELVIVSRAANFYTVTYLCKG